jgi:hypothetical protein
MKLRSLALVLIAFLPVLAFGATITVNWSAPTAAADNTPLTGPQAVTSYQVWVSPSPIAANTTAAPTATVTGSATTTTQTVTAAPGSTIYARVRACNSGGCSPLSSESSKALPVNVPNPPTNVTITVSVE